MPQRDPHIRGGYTKEVSPPGGKPYPRPRQEFTRRWSRKVHPMSRESSGLRFGMRGARPSVVVMLID